MPEVDSSFWNQRYAGDDYFYGCEPNDFIRAEAARIPTGGSVLCLAEGEGRNAVFLAGRGHVVTALDGSPVGLAKAAKLAKAKCVPLTTAQADLSAHEIEPAAWDCILATFMHLNPTLRARVYAQMLAGLKPGGVILIEAYTPAQIAHATGGPREAELCVTLAALREAFAGLEVEIGHEIERVIHEGHGHNGPSAVVQFAARKA